MTSSFQNPRNPLAAMWASAVEQYVRGEHPELNIQQIRELPMMQGVYAHLRHLKQQRRVTQPSGEEGAPTSDPSNVAQMAYLSQTFFDFAVTTAAVATASDTRSEDDLYTYFMALVEAYNQSNNIADFSTRDVGGFALCLIIWIGLTGLHTLNSMERSLLNFLVDQLPLSSTQKAQIMAVWDEMSHTAYKLQYRSASDHPEYQVIPWEIPENAQIVMLGDWGTSMEDAHLFLKAIWKKAYDKNPGQTIVFLHLGDIYYCGLPYECEHYFHEVFTTVGQQLQQEIGNNNFNPTPPIYTIPGNHEYYSYGYGYFELLDRLNQGQKCSFFCLRTADHQWQFLGMDTGRADGNGLLSALQGLGDKAKTWFDQTLPDWRWIQWIANLAVVTYEDFVGPFQPELEADELNWLRDKLDHFGGKTIMLSHHQLFSRQAEIDHNSPQYLNTWLDARFSPYYKDQIAAWYWGHEHTFAGYLDGLMGLNKGRLLGSSSYEVVEGYEGYLDSSKDAEEGGDSPYAVNYPAIPFAPNMTDQLIHKSSRGMYYHAGAIMHQKGSDMSVKYYQFPAWARSSDRPSNPQLEEISEMAEDIKSKGFTSLKPSWIGNVPIAKDAVVTEKGPSITTWNDVLFLLFADGTNTAHLKICTADVAGFKPERRDAVPSWGSPVKIKVENNSLTTSNSPAIIAVNGNLYGFYVDGDKHIQAITAPAAAQIQENWRSLGAKSGKVGDAAPSLCFFQGRIYVVYRESGSSMDQCWAYYDIENNNWVDFGELTVSGDQLKSRLSPALAADAYRIYLVYQQESKSDGSRSTDLRWLIGKPSGSLPEGTSDNITWKDQGDIMSIGKSGTTNPDSLVGMTLTNANGIFFLVYVSTSNNNNNNLTQCALHDIDQERTGEWVGCNTVKAWVSKDKYTTVSSSCIPALAIASGGGFLVYRGNEKDEIYWAYY